MCDHWESELALGIFSTSDYPDQFGTVFVQLRENSQIAKSRKVFSQPL